MAHFNTTHGHAPKGKQTKVYSVWCGIITRCTNSNRSDAANYIGRGITVCDRWRSFENFLADMGEPGPGQTIERRDNSGDYTPENCRWATKREQAGNKRSNHVVEFRGEKKILQDWAREFDLPHNTLWNRLCTLGWSVERALMTPSRSRLRLRGLVSSGAD